MAALALPFLFVSSAASEESGNIDPNYSIWPREVSKINNDAVRVFFSIDSRDGKYAIIGGGWPAIGPDKIRIVYSLSDFRCLVWLQGIRESLIVITRESGQKSEDLSYTVISGHPMDAWVSVYLGPETVGDAIAENEAFAKAGNELFLNAVIEIPMFRIDPESERIVRRDEYMRTVTFGLRVADGEIHWNGLANGYPPD